jgi:hypothetical protein
MQVFLNRFREPSTWAGISALLVVFGIPPGTVDVLVQLGIAIAGAGAVFLPERA